MRFRVTLAVAAVGVASLVPGASGLPSSQIISEVDLGHGAAETWVYLPEGAPACAVVFLHGAGDLTPAAYRAWLSYLAIGMRCAVIFPRYQATAAVAPLSNASLHGLRAGVSAAFAYLRTARFGLYRDPLPKHFPVVVAGYASGGVLALYAAANAKGWGVPVPVAVDSIFPVEGRVRGVPLTPLPAATRVLIQAGDRDKVGGQAAARSLLRSLASHPVARKRLQVVHSTPGFAAVHNAPLQATTAATSIFWDPLDAFIDAATGG
jgi:hypothetical protein